MYKEAAGGDHVVLQHHYINIKSMCDKCLDFVEGSGDVDEDSSRRDSRAILDWDNRVEKFFAQIEYEFESILVNNNITDEDDKSLFRISYNFNIKRLVMTKEEEAAATNISTVSLYDEYKKLQPPPKHNCGVTSWGVAALKDVANYFKCGVPTDRVKFEKKYSVLFRTEEENKEDEQQQHNYNQTDDYTIDEKVVSTIKRSVEFAVGEVEIYTKCPEYNIDIFKYDGCFLVVCINCSPVFCALCRGVIRNSNNVTTTTAATTTAGGGHVKFRTIEPSDYKQFLSRHMNYSFDVE